MATIAESRRRCRPTSSSRPGSKAPRTFISPDTASCRLRSTEAATVRPESCTRSGVRRSETTLGCIRRDEVRGAFEPGRLELVRPTASARLPRSLAIARSPSSPTIETTTPVSPQRHRAETVTPSRASSPAASDAAGSSPRFPTNRPRAERRRPGGDVAACPPAPSGSVPRRRYRARSGCSRRTITSKQQVASVQQDEAGHRRKSSMDGERREQRLRTFVLAASWSPAVLAAARRRSRLREAPPRAGLAAFETARAIASWSSSSAWRGGATTIKRTVSKGPAATVRTCLSTSTLSERTRFRALSADGRRTPRSVRSVAKGRSSASSTVRCTSGLRVLLHRVRARLGQEEAVDGTGRRRFGLGLEEGLGQEAETKTVEASLPAQPVDVTAADTCRRRAAAAAPIRLDHRDHGRVVLARIDVAAVARAAEPAWSVVRRELQPADLRQLSAKIGRERFIRSRL